MHTSDDDARRLARGTCGSHLGTSDGSGRHGPGAVRLDGQHLSSADQEQALARRRAAPNSCSSAKPWHRAPSSSAAGCRRRPKTPARRQRQRPAGRVSLETLNDQLESVPRVSANKFVQAQRDVLAKAVRRGRGQDRPAPRGTRGRAKQFAAAMDEELARLTALKAVNPSVRDSELDSLRTQREEGSPPLVDKASPAPRGDPHPGRRLTPGNGCKTRSHGHPHGFFHFISSEGRNGEWPRGDRSPCSCPAGPEPGVAAESRRSPCDLLTSGKGPPAARVYSVLEASRTPGGRTLTWRDTLCTIAFW